MLSVEKGDSKKFISFLRLHLFPMKTFKNKVSGQTSAIDEIDLFLYRKNLVFMLTKLLIDIGLTVSSLQLYNSEFA